MTYLHLHALYKNTIESIDGAQCTHMSKRNIEPPSCPEGLQFAASILRDFAIAEGAGAQKQQQLIGCLTESYLRALPRPPQCRTFPRNPTPKNWRHLFYCHLAVILGFKERRQTSSEVEHLLRTHLWPDIQEVEREDGVSRDDSTPGWSRRGPANRDEQCSEKRIHEKEGKGQGPIITIRSYKGDGDEEARDRDGWHKGKRQKKT